MDGGSARMEAFHKVRGQRMARIHGPDGAVVPCSDCIAKRGCIAKTGCTAKTGIFHFVLERLRALLKTNSRYSVPASGVSYPGPAVGDCGILRTVCVGVGRPRADHGSPSDLSGGLLSGSHAHGDSGQRIFYE